MKKRLQRRLDWTYFWCAILAVNYASFIKPQLFFPKIPAYIALLRSGDRVLIADRHCLEKCLQGPNSSKML